ncbi:hypothetical protein [Clostridium botulinum]|uniref:hypothetical protein n=1 Tax=Clostridium botulinum TaxID=1491 RepID=UPI003DA5D92A
MRSFTKYTGEVILSPDAHKIKVKAIDNAGNTNDQNSTSSEVSVNIEDKGKKDLEDAIKAERIVIKNPTILNIVGFFILKF